VSCPRLGQAGHGSWYFGIELPREVGEGRLRRGGHGSGEAAAVARERLSVPARGDPGGGVYTVAQWLEAWIETRARLRDSTCRIHKSHIRGHLNARELLKVARTAQAEAGPGTLADYPVPGGGAHLLIHYAPGSRGYRFKLTTPENEDQGHCLAQRRLR
jgi:hypothetical protein